MQKIIRILGSADAEVRPAEPVKLLEVNSNTVSSGVLPVNFGPVPARGIPNASVIVKVSPDEFAKIQNRELQLPDGWLLGDELAISSEALQSE